ncbi:hypothetical protein A3A70_00120 [candidate division WWE3 bacterium RIFCSPLOWO2_01_FULL_42_11]|uniref:Uncharacterized protein n=1 Tax=candidate division WWE3 bacterium RIFCSPLOWO2_01_FULL_42_11 TaxID=1802627 RepID=A0A1F4VR72_UNCKA|nr:MAG: hypothetical protein A3A70_00120 [candidate division WWE3 bacterium RIFCSPLOWO2_01_FULL_42_11]
MSTDGFHLEGFFRALQADVVSLIGFLFFILLAYIIVRVAIVQGDVEFQRVVNWGAGILVLLVLLIFGSSAANYAASNRIPRNDVDGSGVYDQMNSHLATPNPSSGR